MTIPLALRTLKIPRTYRGYRRMIAALELCLSNEREPSAPHRSSLYAQVAARCGCSRSAVESSLRTVISHVWRVSRSALTQMANYPLDAPPKTMEFLSIVTNYIQRSTPHP